MASDSHTIASLKTIKICQSKFSGSRVSEQLPISVSPHAPSAYFVITTKARDSSAPWHCDPRPLARGVLRRYRRKTIII